MHVLYFSTILSKYDILVFCYAFSLKTSFTKQNGYLSLFKFDSRFFSYSQETARNIEILSGTTPGSNTDLRWFLDAFKKLDVGHFD